MASSIALPREGHLATVFQMFSFLKSKKNGTAVLIPAETDGGKTQFPTEDWHATPCGP